jgi:signal transduction histidine kinase
LIARGLKSNTLIQIAVILIIGMILINFVIVETLQQQLLRGVVARGKLLLSSIEQRLPAFHQNDQETTGVNPLGKLLGYPDIVCSAVLDKQAKLVFSGGGHCDQKSELIAATRLAILSREPATQFFEKIWGVFWFQYRYLTVAVPYYSEGGIVGGGGVIISLESIYEKLRRSQKIFFIYILINTVILTFVGVYRMSKMYLEPLQRLAKRAEGYSEEDGLLFAVRKEDNELNQVSKSLNLMLERIAKDKRELRDTVTSLEKANLDLTQAQSEIIQAEKLASVGRLSAGIAHEIGNPIGIVMGYLELLKQKDITDDERSEYIRRTEEEFSRIDTIIRQLLDLSRPSRAGAESVHVHDVLKDITDVIRYQPMMSNVIMTTSLKASHDLVNADPNQLRQVFLNLMLNAADAIVLNPESKEGKLTVRTEVVDTDPESAHMLISVVDNGPGIDPENIGTVFDPFFTTKEPGKGTGLGLSVSFMIIESIGGKISAANEDGGGTRMVVQLPLAANIFSNSQEDSLSGRAKDTAQ